MAKPKEFLIELRSKTEGELTTMLQDSRNELSMLTLHIAAGKETETHKLGQMRKKIAQIQTVLHEASAQAETSSQHA